MDGMVETKVIQLWEGKRIGNYKFIKISINPECFLLTLFQTE